MKRRMPKRSRSNGHKAFLQNYWQLYFMLIIPVVWLVLFCYKPMLGVVIAFKKFNIFAGIWDSPWVGFQHFQDAFRSAEFWLALKNTLILNLGDVVIGFPIPILLAVFLNELTNKLIRKTTQVILYLPNFLSWVIIAGIVTQLCSSTGLINNILASFGGNPVDFLSSPNNWRFVYWISGVWQGAGYSLIIYLAALAGTDPSLGEAAYIDGANRIERIWHVTLPQIRSTITMILIMQLGKIVSIGFERPFMMGNTLVKEVSDVISTYVYSVGLQSARYDFATAVGLFQSVVGVLLVLTVNAMAKKIGEEGIM